MGRGAVCIAVVAVLALAARGSASAVDQPTAWGGANPFTCELQWAGFGTAVPHPGADPYCVEFDKRHQNVTQLGIVDFLSKEPARVAAASDKCFYFQSDHWRAAVVQDDGSTKLYEWDGHYFFDKARGDGGAWVTNFNVNGHTGDPSGWVGILSPEWAQDFGPGTGGVITHDDIPVDASCVAKAANGHVYAEHERNAPSPPPQPPCGDARGPVTSHSIGPLALGMSAARARERLGAPRAVRGRSESWCTLTATFRGGRIAALRTGSPIYELHGIRPGSRVRWRAGVHRIGRNVAIGVRGHRVRWLACARAS